MLFVKETFGIQKQTTAKPIHPGDLLRMCANIHMLNPDIRIHMYIKIE